jgi:CheY-like chemotaxis protein
MPDKSGTNSVTSHYNSNERPLRRILLAEDNQISQMVTSRLLEKADYTVDVVDNGHEAIKALAATDYDLVIMDCSMPVMDGFTATREIRASGSMALNSAIPIIALIALDTKSDREKCFEAGMNDFVSKPVESGLLISAIKRCLVTNRDDEASSLQEQVDPVLNDEFMNSIIDKFLNEVPLVMLELEQALELGDVVALKNISHRLRGPAGIIKADTLSKCSASLEQAARSNDFRLTAKFTMALISELKKLMGTLSDE